MEPFRNRLSGRSGVPIHSIPYSVAQPLERGYKNYYSIIQGNAWHFGYKAHVGVDKDSGLAHTVEVTGANTQDGTMTSKLLTGGEEAVYGDSG